MKIIDDWYKITIIADSVTAISENDMVTMYLIEGTKKALLLDTGWGIHNLKNVISTLTNLPVIVMHTHCHIDHVSGAWQFDKILIPHGDEALLAESYEINERKLHYEIMLLDYMKGAEAYRWINAKLCSVEIVKPDYVFDLGKRKITMLPFPGHTMGSVVFFDEEDGLLFTGDSISSGTLWMHTEASAPLSMYLNSLHGLLKYRSKIKLLLPAHGRTPVEPEIIEEYTNGAENILSGKIKGTYIENHGGEGLFCQLKQNSIIYNDKNL